MKSKAFPHSFSLLFPLSFASRSAVRTLAVSPKKEKVEKENMYPPSTHGAFLRPQKKRDWGGGRAIVTTLPWSLRSYESTEKGGRSIKKTRREGRSFSPRKLRRGGTRRRRPRDACCALVCTRVHTHTRARARSAYCTRTALCCVTANAEKIGLQARSPPPYIHLHAVQVLKSSS